MNNPSSTTRRRPGAICALLLVLALGVVACGRDGTSSPGGGDEAPSHGGTADALPKERFDDVSRAFLAQPARMSIVLAGAFFGRHKPCGCSAPQLGGMERLAALMDRLRARSDGHLLALALGWNLRGSGEDQEEAKAGFLRAALAEMGFQGILLGDTDLGVPAMVQPYGGGGVNAPIPPLNVILPDSSPAKGGSIELRAGLEGLDVRAMTLVDPGEAEELKAMGYAEEVLGVTAPFAMLTPDDQALWIVAARLPDRAAVEALAAAVKRFGPAIIVDFGGAAGVTEFDSVPFGPDMEPLIVSVEEMGKHVGVLDFNEDESGARTLSYRSIALVPELERDTSPSAEQIESLLHDYIDVVREEDYLSRFPSMADFDSSFVGSQACAKCHSAIYEDWNESNHAHAMPTLRRAKYDWDPECVRCHVVGWYRQDDDRWARFDSGFLNDRKTRELANVGCENCHGPGSRHVASPDIDKFRPFNPKGEDRLRQWRKRCVKCHDIENSHGFVQDWVSYFEHVDHRAVPSDRRTNWK